MSDVYSHINADLFCLAVLPSGLSRVVRSAGVLRPRYGRADQLDQVGHQTFLYFQKISMKSLLWYLTSSCPSGHRLQWRLSLQAALSC